MWDGHFGVLPDTDQAIDLLAELADGRPILEYGVGVGRLALPTQDRQLVVHGVDNSPWMVWIDGPSLRTIDAMCRSTSRSLDLKSHAARVDSAAAPGSGRVSRDGRLVLFITCLQVRFFLQIYGNTWLGGLRWEGTGLRVWMIAPGAWYAEQYLKDIERDHVQAMAWATHPDAFTGGSL
jgi:hypothetical protein